MDTRLGREKVALVAGGNGQDGSYLGESLLRRRHAVYGLKRRASSFKAQRIDYLYKDPHLDDVRLGLQYGDLSDASKLMRLIRDIKPEEVYNLAVQSHIAVILVSPEYTADVDGLGTLRLLEPIRFLRLTKKMRLYQALTSELYSLVQEVPQHAGIATAISGDMAPSVKVGDTVLCIDPGYFRPLDVEHLLGDPNKAKERLGWAPEISARDMRREMVASDYEAARRYGLLKTHGLDLPVSLET